VIAIICGTALDPEQPAVSIGLLQGVLPKRPTLEGLRQDRILHEAFATADPLKLMRLFDITEQTAMRYVTAAHPARTAKLPRRGGQLGTLHGEAPGMLLLRSNPRLG
jgi:hypothetical protein